MDTMDTMDTSDMGDACGADVTGLTATLTLGDVDRVSVENASGREPAHATGAMPSHSPRSVLVRKCLDAADEHHRRAKLLLDGAPTVGAGTRIATDTCHGTSDSDLSGTLPTGRAEERIDLRECVGLLCRCIQARKRFISPAHHLVTEAVRDLGECLL